MRETNLDVYKMEREAILKKLKVRNAQRDVLTYQLTRVDRAIAEDEKEMLREATGVDLYSAGDYAGLSTGRYKFYFGYEEQVCAKHADCTCEDKEWAFTADVDDKTVMVIPASKLGQSGVVANLLHGIGQYLASMPIQANEAPEEA